MDKRSEISDELRDWGSPLADLSRVMPYAVPVGYWESLPGQLRQSVADAEMEDPVVNWPKTMPYAVPQGYFNMFPDKMSFIASNQIKGEAKDTFEVPGGYFEQLPQQLLAAAKAADVPVKTQAKVIPLGNKIWGRARLAAAAILILGIGLGSYTLFAPKVQQPEAQLAALSKGAIDDYINQNIDDFDTDMLENTLAVNEVEPINNLKDEEIIQYLNETGWEQNVN